MLSTSYDAWKLAEPDEKVVSECCQCQKEIINGQEILFDQEGDVHFCDEDCLAEYVRKHPREFTELIIEHFFEKVIL